MQMKEINETRGRCHSATTETITTKTIMETTESKQCHNKNKKNNKNNKYARIDSYDALHDEGFGFLADNVYIHHGYRLHYSFSQCIRSIFQLHNETWNIWTHLIGSLVFLYLFNFVLTQTSITTDFLSSSLPSTASIPNPVPISSLHPYYYNTKFPFSSYLHDICPLVNTTNPNLQTITHPSIASWITTNSENSQLLSSIRTQGNHIKEEYYRFLEYMIKEKELVTNNISQLPEKWPLFVFLACSVICLMCSTLFHLFYVHSDRFYKLFSRLDYTGISLMIAGSNFPVIYYSFYCYENLRTLYLGIITFLATLTVIAGLVPAFGTPKFIVLRTSIYVLLGASGLIPLSHLIWIYGINDPHLTIMLEPILWMGGFYLLGAIIYSTRFPESCFPGKFDLYFSSHQIWHVCVLVAALIHYFNAIQHHAWRCVTSCG